MKNISFFITALLLPAFFFAQQIIHVPDDYETIQAAVDAAGYGDTILVSQGRYEENVIIQGNNKAVTLASNFIFSGDTIDIINTIIDASQPQNPNYGMGVLLKNIDTSLMPKVAGFTISGGTGYYKTYGGGIHSTGAIPVIENNHIEDCSITGTQPSGAGIRVGQGIWDTNKVCLIRYNIIKNCTIHSVSNTVVGEGAGISLGPVSAFVEGNTITDNHIAGNSTSNAYGGGILYSTGNPVYHTIQAIIRNNIITGNVAEAGIAGGGGIAFYDDNGWAHLVMEGNTITGNEVKTLSSSTGNALGGGVLIENPASGSEISANIISDNFALEGLPGSNRFGGGMHLNHTLAPDPEYFLLIGKNRITGNFAVRGAAINCQFTTINLVNNFISGNQAETHAGGIYLHGSGNGQVISFINNTFTENQVSGEAGQGGSMYITYVPAVLLMNNIYYGNDASDADEIRIYSSTVEIHNCDINPDAIDGTWTGDSNFYADPEFIDEMTWDNWNYDAPCSNSGIDSLKVFGISFHAPTSCIGNNPRPLDGAIDVGACEVDMLYVGIEPPVGSSQFVVGSYPNPFSGFTTLDYELKHSATVNLSIYNHLGQQVAVLVDGEQAAGRQQVRWEAEGMPAGIYFFRLTVGGQMLAIGKLVIK